MSGPTQKPPSNASSSQPTLPEKAAAHRVRLAELKAKLVARQKESTSKTETRMDFPTKMNSQNPQSSMSQSSLATTAPNHMASAVQKAAFTHQVNGSSNRECQTALPDTDEHVETLACAAAALAITKAEAAEHTKTTTADHPSDGASIVKADSVSQDASQSKPERNTNDNSPRSHAKLGTKAKVPTGPKSPLNKTLLQLPSHPPLHNQTLCPLSKAAIGTTGTRQSPPTHPPSNPVSPVLAEANARNDMTKPTTRDAPHAGEESNANLPARPRPQSAPRPKKHNTRRRKKKAPRAGARPATPTAATTAIMARPKWPPTARRPSGTDAFRPALRDPHLDLERRASQDRDLRDWLHFTGWDDEGYRRRFLDRQRRLAEIDRERTALMDADQRENRTRRDSGPEDAERAQPRAPEGGPYEPALAARHAHRELFFSPDRRADYYHGSPTSGFKREYDGDHNVRSPRKVARTDTRGSRHGPSRGLTLRERALQWHSGRSDEDRNPNYQPVRGSHTGVIAPPRFQGPQFPPPRFESGGHHYSPGDVFRRGTPSRFGSGDYRRR